LGKWNRFSRANYRIVDLGRSVVFFLPVKKLRMKVAGVCVEKSLHCFLEQNFPGYSVSAEPSFGFWKDELDRHVPDKCKHYEVSFHGKKLMHLLMSELARIASLTGEKCIYLNEGGHTCLVYPKE
jgi:hypothetical protein